MKVRLVISTRSCKIEFYEFVLSVKPNCTQEMNVCSQSPVLVKEGLGISMT